MSDETQKQDEHPPETPAPPAPTPTPSAAPECGHTLLVDDKEPTVCHKPAGHEGPHEGQ